MSTLEEKTDKNSKKETFNNELPENSPSKIKTIEVYHQVKRKASHR